MPRPSGAPFWGERLPLDDGGDLVGIANTNGAVNVYVAITYYGDGQYATLVPGNTIIAIASRSGTYLETGDTVDFSWVIRCKGTATAAFRDDFDPSWDYSSPANDLGSQSVAYADFTELVIPTTSLNVDSILDFDGQRLTVEVTSGSLDIDQVSLQVYPPGGPVGYWTGEMGTGAVEVPISTPTDAHAVGYGSDVSGPPTSFQASHDSAVADLLAQTSTTGTGTPHNVVGGTLFGAIDAGSWFLEDHVQTYSVPINNAIPDPVGTEGTDYIRRPDRTAYDVDAYLNFNGAPLLITGWVNSVISVIRDRGLDDDGNFRVYLTDYGVLDPADAVGAANLVLDETAYDAAAAPGTPRVTEFSVDPLVSTPAWTYSLMSSWVTEDAPVSTWNSPIVGLGVRIFLGSSDFVTYWEPLTAVVAVPAFRYWDPNGTPGRLKVWLPSDEWRIVGDEAGSDTERLKIQTPDLTWWKEYRTSDGAVAVHPLKLYTADGWVIASMMTPD
jgi:hypothetical protein